MALDTTTGDAILKDVFEGPLRDQINQMTPLLDYFTDGNAKQRKWEGRQVIVPLHKSRNSGVKSLAIDSGLLPAAGNQGTVDAKIPMKKVMGRIQLSADVIETTKNDEGAFIRALQLEQDFMVKDIARHRNRYFAYFGQGTLATISSGTASATQALANPGNVSGSTNATRFIQPGDVVAFTDSTGATLRGVRTVSSLSEPNIVVDSSVTTTTGDLVSRGTTVGATEASFNAECMGILGLVDSTTYVSSVFNIDRSQAANAFYRSNVITSVGALNPDVLNRAADNTEEVSGQKIDRWLCHYSVRREVWKLTEADRRYNVNPGNNGGASFDAGPAKSGDFFYAGRPGKADKDFAYGTLIGISDGHLELYQLGKPGWADDDGTILLRTSTQDQYEARYRLRENTFNDQGNAFVRLDGITATVSSGVFSA
jgi:hypothetical protein